MRGLWQHKGKKDPSVSLHNFPANPTKKQYWCETFGVSLDDLKPYYRVCSRHFKDGNIENGPDPTLGKRFASPKKRWTSRAQRASRRDTVRVTQRLFSPTPRESETPSRSPTPASSSAQESSSEQSPMTVSVGEPLVSDYQVHELYSDSPGPSDLSTSVQISNIDGRTDISTEVLANAALLARTEVLESENGSLKEKVKTLETKPCAFRIEDIAHGDKLVRLYISYMVLISFFKFLGPSVNELSYWGGRKVTQRNRQRRTKLSALNQFFLTLV